jgi:uncharacterized protein YyaL (SSP411 family)
MNPVDWYPWGKEAFTKARNDNKPIFLSVGYSTCHWCHQFAKESFEDEKVAAFINKNFIPIKVDREEMPEVDAYYMGAVQAMTGSGGWPLSVFLTPDLKPFYGGTYFPPEPNYGMPSFMQLLEFVSTLWKDKRDEVAANSEQVMKALSESTARPAGDLGKASLDEGYSALISSFDPEHGGFGTAPKFPVPSTLGYLLRYNYRSGKELALSSVLRTLDGMAAGGIRDHLGGGFHRYSTDRIWLVPHFEKMLYDNALLAKLYVEAYQATGNPRYASVAEETLRWVEGEMRDPSGGFYSAQDADTADGEGNYYTWTPDEVVRALGPTDGARFNSVYGVTKTGNFEGRTILHLDPTHNPTKAEFEAVKDLKKKLYEARLKRPRPATDTKILTSWNGLAISALSFSGLVLGEQRHIRLAEEAALFVLNNNAKGGKLLRRYAGGEAALEGTLEDYTFFVNGLIDLFEATADPKWLREAIRLTKVTADDYEDKGSGGFYLTVSAVPARLREAYDGPTPSGNSVAATNLIRLAELTGEAEYRKKAEGTLKAFGGEIERNPTSHTFMLAALDLIVNGVREVVITAPTAKEAASMRAEVFRRFIPDKVVAIATTKTFDELSELSALLEGRRPSKGARAYVCRNFACKLPADSTETLREQLTAR